MIIFIITNYESSAITCPSPTPPTHGRLIDSGRYLSGDYIQFTCITGYVLVGESLSVCLENGTWSSPEPKCKRRFKWSCECLLYLYI